MASKSPQGLTELVEQISGSVALRRPYEEFKAAAAAAETAHMDAQRRKKAAAQESKTAKGQKDEAQLHARVKAELVRGCFAVLNTNRTF